MWHLLTPAATRAVRLAHRRALAEGAPVIAPQHLLFGLLAGESTATRLLQRLGVGTAELLDAFPPLPDASDTEEARRLSGPAEWLLKSALEESRRRGNRSVSTAHLLIALAGAPELAGHDLLAERQVTPALLREALTRVRADEAAGRLPANADDADRSEPEPAAVTATLALMGLSLMAGMPAIVLTVVLWVTQPAGLDLRFLLWSASALWTALVSLFLVVPVHRRKRSAWAVVLAGLFTKTTAVSATAAGLLATGNPGLFLLGTGFAAFGLVLGLVCAGFFRAGTWFGIERRQGWRTLLREGWWSLAVTGLLDLSLLMAVALGARR